VALFTNLHHVGEVLVQLITSNLDVATGVNVQVGPPLDTVTGAGEEIRVTLLWLTLQPTHRSDPAVADATGQLVPPPVTVSVFYLITTYGSVAEDPIRGHELLGNVLQAFHTFPSVTLPLAAVPAAGEGRLTFVQVPITPELMEHIFTPVQAKHRPWVLYEVGPVQLAMRKAPTAQAGLVRPGGISLSGPSPVSSPIFLRLTPASQAAGGVVRLDLDLKGRSLAGITAGSEFVPFPSASITETSPGKTFLLTLPASVTADRGVELRARTQSVADPPVQFTGTQRLGVLTTTTPTLDAPAPRVLTAALSLAGRALSTANELLIWPDVSLVDPSAIKSFTPTAAATSVSLPAGALSGAGLVAGTYRCAVRLSNGQFTPFVLLELT
jgi:hypothetical protein